MDIRTATSTKLSDRRKLLYDDGLLNERGIAKSQQFIDEAEKIIALLTEAEAHYRTLEPVLRLFYSRLKFKGTLNRLNTERSWLQRLKTKRSLVVNHRREDYMCTCWTITKVFGEVDPKEVGTAGPRCVYLGAEGIKNHPDAITFRMKDGDGEVVYEGKMVLGDESEAVKEGLWNFQKEDSGV